MTFSVLEGHSPITTLFLCDIFYLCFYFSIHFYCYMYVWYVQINKYLLTYFRPVGLYSHCMHGTLSQ